MSNRVRREAGAARTASADSDVIRERTADPCVMVIFGATGDLTQRLVVPALYNLSRTGLLPEKFALVGVARSDMTADDWRDHLFSALKSFVDNPATGFDIDHIDQAAWRRLTSKHLLRPGRPDGSRAL